MPLDCTNPFMMIYRGRWKDSRTTNRDVIIKELRENCEEHLSVSKTRFHAVDKGKCTTIFK